MDAISVEALRRMCGQAGIAIGFLDQILRSSPLAIEPDDKSNRFRHVGHEHSIFVRSRVEQLILFALIRLVVIWFVASLLVFLLRLPCGFVISQGHETGRLGPASWLVKEFAFLVGVGLR